MLQRTLQHVRFGEQREGEQVLMSQALLSLKRREMGERTNDLRQNGVSDV